MRGLRRFIRNQAGGTLVMFALAMPAVAMLGCAAVDLASVSSDRSKVQDTVDAAALAAAKQLGVADGNGVTQRAEAFVREQLKPLDARMTYTVSTVPSQDRASVTVSIAGSRTSFFANMLPPGGWKIANAATATRMAQTPLCILSHGKGKADATDITTDAQLIAPECLVHSNGDVRVNAQGWLKAAVVQTAGVARGRITPEPQIGAPPIDDPFLDMKIDGGDGACLPLPLLYIISAPLAAGTHCGDVIVMKNATVRLTPGVHYFNKGDLKLGENSQIIGDNVVLIFDRDSKFEFTDESRVELSGRESGKYAGFVIATTRDNDQTFRIASTAARKLLGTIYIPAATLEVTGDKHVVAQDSDWTVVVAKSLELSDGAKLVVNADYAGSDVPVPNGVGPNGRDVALTK